MADSERSDSGFDRETEFQQELARARAGDREALDRVLRRIEESAAIRVSQTMGEGLGGCLRNSDVMQSAWLEVLRSLPEFRGGTEASFMAWVNAIIENSVKRLARFFRAQRRRPPAESAELRQIAERRERPPPTPSTVVTHWEDMALATAALNNLGYDYREVIRLTVIDSLPHKEVAQRMDRSESATRMLLSRARAALTLEVERLERR